MSPPPRADVAKSRRVGKPAWVALAVLALAAGPLAGDGPPVDLARFDPAKVVGFEACGECHVHEARIWKGTPHAEGFRTLHRSALAEGIASKLGFRLIKRDSLCMRCHYTASLDGGELRARSGVSCESCHGPGRDWLDVHNDYGPGGEKSAETPEHRAARIEESRAKGMRRPSEIYDVAASCFECHTVPEEQLVNVGGHTTGSAGFELVEWTQGEIRHNFLATLQGAEPENPESPTERRRLLYVAGRLADLEFSLRGMATATVDGIYSKAMGRRVRSALAEVRVLARVLGSSELDGAVAAVRDVRVVPENRAALLGAASRVGDAARAFLDARDGTENAVVDRALAGEPLEDDPEPVFADLEPGGGPAGTEPGADPADPAGAAPPAAPGGGGGAPADPGVPAVGERRTRIRTPTGHDTLGPAACSGCHASQNQWWFGDPHFASAEAFFSPDSRRVKIARLYGLNPARVTRGDHVCMDCHGSVITGKETRDVLDGVGCESCHGGAADYLEPHKEGEKSLGPERPGYRKALGLGMRELLDLETRAATCASCHYITDPRLISAGHPVGGDWSFAEGVAKIRHWEDPPESADRLAAAFRGVVAARGPVPEVRLARLPGGGGGGAGGGVATTSGGGGGGGGGPRTAVAPAPSRPVGSARSNVPRAPRETAPLDLEAFPTVDESLPVEEVLLVVKRRLEALYEAIAAAEAER